MLYNRLNILVKKFGWQNWWEMCNFDKIEQLNKCLRGLLNSSSDY